MCSLNHLKSLSLHLPLPLYHVKPLHPLLSFGRHLGGHCDRFSLNKPQPLLYIPARRNKVREFNSENRDKIQCCRRNGNLLCQEKTPRTVSSVTANYFLYVKRCITTHASNCFASQNYHVAVRHRVPHTVLSYKHYSESHRSLLSCSTTYSHLLLRKLHQKRIPLLMFSPESSSLIYFKNVARFYRGQMRGRDVNKRRDENSDSDGHSDEISYNDTENRYFESRSTIARNTRNYDSLRDSERKHIRNWESERDHARNWDNERNNARNWDSKRDNARNWDSERSNARNWDNKRDNARNWDSERRNTRNWDSGRSNARNWDSERSNARNWDSERRNARNWDSGRSNARNWDSERSNARNWDSERSNARNWDSERSNARNWDSERSSARNWDGKRSNARNWGGETSNPRNWDGERSNAENWDSERSNAENWDSERSNEEKWDSERSIAENWDSERSNVENWDSERSNEEKWDSERSIAETWDSERSDAENWDSERSNSENWDSERSSAENWDSERSSAENWDSERDHARTEAAKQDCADNSDSQQDHDLVQPSAGDTLSTGHTGVTVRRKSADEMTLPELSRVSFSLVPFVKRSVTLQNLVRLGVNLDQVQRVKEVAELLIRSDFERDIVPFLKFLRLVGVESDKIGYIFTCNPLLFKESVEDLEVRIGYLLHRNFGLREVAAMITKAPVILLMNPVMLEEKLEFMENVFNLTAHEVREVIKLYPKILPWKKEFLAEMKFHIKEFIGFNDSEIKQIILKYPKTFMMGKNTLVHKFDYLHNHMMIPHSQIVGWPVIFRKRLFVFKNRHLFLLHRGRAQYDPCQENYISLKVLGLNSDEEFCRQAAKCSVEEFYDFCKTL